MDASANCMRLPALNWSRCIFRLVRAREWDTEAWREGAGGDQKCACIDDPARAVSHNTDAAPIKPVLSQ